MTIGHRRLRFLLDSTSVSSVFADLCLDVLPGWFLLTSCSGHCLPLCFYCARQISDIVRDIVSPDSLNEVRRD